jgi:hypothetical protein
MRETPRFFASECMNNEPLNFSNFARDMNGELNIFAKAAVIEPKFDAMSLAKSLVEQLHRLNDLQAHMDSDPFANDGPDGQLENLMAERIREKLNQVCKRPEELRSLGVAMRDLGAMVDIGFNLPAHGAKQIQHGRKGIPSDFSPSTQDSVSESHRGWIKIGWNGLSRSTNLYVVRRVQDCGV